MARPNSFVQANRATVQGGQKLASYEFREGEDCVESEAVTLTDACGDELLGARPADRSLPVVATFQRSTLHHGYEDTPVTAIAVRLLHENRHRVTGLIQNTGSAPIRVGRRGVTATTGIRLVPNATVIYEEPNANKNSIWAIREGSVDSVAFAQEETVHYHSGHEHEECAECAEHALTECVEDDLPEGD